MAHLSEAERWRDLPRGAAGRASTLWMGMVLFILIEGTVMASIITSYYYLRVTVTEPWPPPGVAMPDLGMPSVSLLALVLSVFPVAWARGRFRVDDHAKGRLGLLLGVGLAAAYLILSGVEAAGRGYSHAAHTYGSIVWVLSGYQIFHVIALLGLGSSLVGFARGGRFDGVRRAPVEAVALYWAFVVIAAIPSYVTLYLAPRWL